MGEAVKVEMGRVIFFIGEGAERASQSAWSVIKL